MTRRICTTDSDGHSSRFSQFQLNIDPADRIEELKLDVTAPMIAASPSRPTSGGTALREQQRQSFRRAWPEGATRASADQG